MLMLGIFYSHLWVYYILRRRLCVACTDEMGNPKASKSQDK